VRAGRSGDVELRFGSGESRARTSDFASGSGESRCVDLELRSPERPDDVRVCGVFMWPGGTFVPFRLAEPEGSPSGTDLDPLIASGLET
jgi:hypothetical protein